MFLFVEGGNVSVFFLRGNFEKKKLLKGEIYDVFESVTNLPKNFVFFF